MGPANKYHYFVKFYVINVVDSLCSARAGTPAPQIQNRVTSLAKVRDGARERQCIFTKKGPFLVKI